MADYKQMIDPMTGQLSGTIVRVADGAFIPNDPANMDRAAYLAWCAAGHVPDPPDALPVVAPA